MVRGGGMAKAYEISVWEPLPDKFDELNETIKSLAKAFVEAGVSKVELLSGVAGKDVGHVVVIQHFKGLADNGAMNETIMDSVPMKTWREEHAGDFPAKLISHDLYSEIEG
jgi:hypothetical protein